MNNEEKILQILEQVNGRLDKMDGRFDKMDGRFDKLETKVDRIDKTVIKIENEHGQKIAALFDGHTQNTQILERIEKEVSRQEEIILRKVL